MKPKHKIATAKRAAGRAKKPKRRVALVLGGGGLKGFAHIGVLRALEEQKIKPVVYAGTSIGALIASAAAGGMPVPEMAEHARALRKRDLFRINRMGMIVSRLQLPAIYLEGPLRAICASITPPGTFDELKTTLLVNTVDLQRGTQVVWGLPGLRNVNIADAVYASCALPGFFPPGVIDRRALPRHSPGRRPGIRAAPSARARIRGNRAFERSAGGADLGGGRHARHDRGVVARRRRAPRRPVGSRPEALSDVVDGNSGQGSP